jgi:hypothetical protein
MRYRRNLPPRVNKAPAENKHLNLNVEELAVITLWMFGGFSKKQSWIMIYRPRCKPNSIPPQVSLFFNRFDVIDCIHMFREHYEAYPYLNEKIWSEFGQKNNHIDQDFH